MGKKGKAMKKLKSKSGAGIRNRGNSYMKIDQYKSVPGLISILVAAGTLLLLNVLFVLSYLKKGQAGMWIGLLGLLLLVVAIFGAGLGIYAIRDSEARKGRPVVGTICNLLLVALLLFLYLSHISG